WLARHGSGTTWNLILVSGSGGSTGSFEYADGVSVETSRRAPLKPELWTQDRLGDGLPAGADIVNIRALMAGDDYLLDLRILADRGELSEEDIQLLDGVDRKSASAVKARSEEHTSELQSRFDLVCRPLLEKKKVAALHHVISR